MPYKTILVHVDQSSRLSQHVRIAVEMASAVQGHVIGTAMTGVSTYLYENPSVGAGEPYLASHLAVMKRIRGEALDRFESELGKSAPVSYERRLVLDETAGGLTLQAHYCDLVVMGQTDPDDFPSAAIFDLPAYVMLHCARPVLIIPYHGDFSNIEKRVLVAWDGSSSATRALVNAMPLLRRAQKVDLAVFNPHRQPIVHGEQPGVDIALYLARHDISVNVICNETDASIGSALLSLSDELESTCLVMGGYGHTRFRETMLGGVTHTVLESMTVPVLMSH